MVVYLCVLLLIQYSEAQYTNDCGIDYGCLKVPAGCDNSNCKYIVKWRDEFVNTQFILMTYVNSTSVYESWTAVGFSNDVFMGSDSVVMCRMSSNAQVGKIETYFNNGRNSQPLNPQNPAIGISNGRIEVFNTFSYLTCRFSRQKAFPGVGGYFDLSAPNRYNILIASGSVNNLGEPLFHGTNGFYASPYRQNFESIILAGPDPTTTSSTTTTSTTTTSTTTSTTTTTANYYHAITSPKKKTHSCLMIFAWVLFASVGLLMPRYYKYICKPAKVCGSHVWFILHFSLMIIVALFNIIALLVILSDLNWKWISTTRPLHFTHSVFGMMAMGLIFLQLLLGTIQTKFRKDSKLRKASQITHSTIGAIALVFSVVAMFLGSVMEEMNLDRLGWTVLIGWAAWVIILPLIMEILKQSRLGVNKRSSAYELSGTLRENYEKLGRYKKIYYGIKSTLFVIHNLVALGITISLVVLIGLTDDYYW